LTSSWVVLQARARLVGGAATAIVWALMLHACATAPPEKRPPPRSAPEAERPREMRLHVVQSGETAYRISKQYGTSVEAIARANPTLDVTRISPGQTLRVPEGAPQPRASAGASVARAATFGAIDPRGRVSGRPVFAWPVQGSVSSSFGFRSGAHHDGVDIPAAKGTPVRAAESGRVIHAGDTLAGYGNLIIVKHTGRYSTVYAHNRKNLVRQGEFVEKGQVIAEVGDSGNASSPHLHFEVRENGSPRNPIGYLP
jgi:murein DD-endopeptidase MepM/ murein hydrolase activator NlpD